MSFEIEIGSKFLIYSKNHLKKYSISNVWTFLISRIDPGTRNFKRRYFILTRTVPSYGIKWFHVKRLGDFFTVTICTIYPRLKMKNFGPVPGYLVPVLKNRISSKKWHFYGHFQKKFVYLSPGSNDQIFLKNQIRT